MKLSHYLQKYNSSEITGLSDVGVIENRKKFGENIVTNKKRHSFLYILLLQFGGFFSVVLSIAGILLFLLGELIDFYVVLAVIVINVCIQAIQQYKSDSIFENLTKTLPVFSVVIRQGKKKKISSTELVVGDILLLQAGERVPCDGLVFFSENLKVDESIITGESKSVSKISSDQFRTDVIIDNAHVVFAGSYVTTGTAHVLVHQIGDATQIGLIAQKISTVDTQLPLYKDIKKLSFGIFIFVSIFLCFIFVAGIIQNQSIFDIGKITVALLVSAIPESLPVMLTLILAYGFKRMSEKNVLVRKMQSLDVLGKIDVLALDKTGTITHNQMKVEKIFTFDQSELYITGNGYEPKGQMIYKSTPIDISNFQQTQLLIAYGVLSSDGSYYFDNEKKDWVLESGDPTEVSLLVLGEKINYTKEFLYSKYVRIENVPFTNQTKYHSATYSYQNKKIKIYTGAPEIIYAMSTHVRIGDSYKKINEKIDEIFHKKIKEYASAGYRILATCVEEGSKTVCYGLFAINDSIRADVIQSVKDIYQRGISIIMITGDHKDVALQVGQKIGIHATIHTVLTGEDMLHMNDSQIKNVLGHKNIFARVTPQQKLKILELLKEIGKIVAMTGDGINDTLALAKADIGIAMGTISSDAAKEAADIVLLDNKFGSVVYGIEEGENIFSNIRKTVLFLLSTNFAGMFVVVFAITLALPLPLSATGILWLNLVTDTFLVIGFAFERSCVRCMQSPRIVTFHEWRRIIFLGSIMTLVALIVFMTNHETGIIYAQSLTLLVLIIMQWFNLLNIRAGDQSIFSNSNQKNIFFSIGFVISLILTVCAFNIEFIRNILQIHPINFGDWMYVLVFASLIIWFEEIRKIAQRTRLFVRK